MRTLSLVLAIALLALSPPIAAAQTPTSTIRGTVHDASGRPVGDAQLFAFPTDRETRTDAAGQFVFTGLAPGVYRIRARHVGYAVVDANVELRGDREASVKLVFNRAVLPLDTVRVTASAKCSRLSVDGFACRRGREEGVFLDYSEITARNAEYRGDLFRGIDGFRVQYVPCGFGCSSPIPHEIAERGWRCIHNLVNGKPADFKTNPLPDISNILAMEVYREARDVPQQYMANAYPSNNMGNVLPGPNGTLRMTGPPSVKMTHEPCGVVLYWTLDAPRHP